jgi:hypothetical protein
MTIEILWTDKCGDVYAIITTHFPGGGFSSKQTKNGQVDQEEIMWCGDGDAYAYAIITTHFPGGLFISKQTKNGQVVQPPSVSGSASSSPHVQYPVEPTWVHVLDSFCTYRSAVRRLCLDCAKGMKSDDEFRALLLWMQ